MNQVFEAAIPATRCSYVLGNPPFIGKHLLSVDQKADMGLVWGEVKGAGVLDYVTAWYLKAAQYITGGAHSPGSARVSRVVSGVPPETSSPQATPHFLSDSNTTRAPSPRSLSRDAKDHTRDACAPQIKGETSK